MPNGLGSEVDAPHYFGTCWCFEVMQLPMCVACSCRLFSWGVRAAVVVMRIAVVKLFRISFASTGFLYWNQQLWVYLKVWGGSSPGGVLHRIVSHGERVGQLPSFDGEGTTHFGLG